MQNELLFITANLVLDAISDEVRQAEFYGIMVDETKDITKQEQLSVVVRYYLNGTVFERFLGYTSAENLDAKSLFSYIQKTLTNCNIDMNKCVCQTQRWCFSNERQNKWCTGLV